MGIFSRTKKVNPELEREKALQADRESRTDSVVRSFRELQKRNQFRDQLAMTLFGGQH